MTEQELQELVNGLCDQYGYERAQVQVKPLKTSYAWRKHKERIIVFDTRFSLSNTRRTLERVAKHEIVHLKFHSHNALFGAELRRMGMRPYKDHRTRQPYWSEREKIHRY